jgi:protein SCO1/2
VRRAGPGHALAALLLVVAGPAAAAPARGPLKGPLPPAALEVEVRERLGATVPAGLAFVDEKGHRVSLGDFRGRGPLLLVLAYYRCPMLCDLVLRGLAQGLHQVGWVPGTQFQALTVSIDPKDTPGAARLKQGHVLSTLGHPDAVAGWPFLTGEEAAARQLAAALGVSYVYDRKSDQYAHPAVAVVLTPEGRVSRYLYGVEFRPFDLRLALVEASQGKVGGAVERVLLTCFRYDPAARKYGFYVLGVLKGGGLLVLGTFGAFLLLMFRRDRARQRGFAAPRDAPRGLPPC